VPGKKFDARSQDTIAQAAKMLGTTKYFFQSECDIIDDHKSFLDVGIPSVDVVDAEFGRMGPQFDGMGRVSSRKFRHDGQGFEKQPGYRRDAPSCKPSNCWTDN
jgi:hypothetical protein